MRDNKDNDLMFPIFVNRLRRRIVSGTEDQALKGSAAAYLIEYL